MKKGIFWARFGLFALFGLIIPLAFIIWRFELFQKVSATTFGVWGILCIILVFAFAIVVSKYLMKGMPYSYATQIVSGIFKVVAPCLIVWVIAYKMREEMDLFIQVMACVTISETVAICVNPLPEWVHENRKSEAQDLIDVLVDKRDKK